MRLSMVAWLMVVAVGGVGCMTPPVVRHNTTTFTRKTYTKEECLQGVQACTAKDKTKDKVLWQYRASSEAMRLGEYALAKQLLDDALLGVGGIMSKVKGAEDSRGLFTDEAKKTFLGEPYERVMAYYYRGILYWMDGEPDNARACFLNAQFQDSDTFEKKYSGDYAILDYLDGLAMAKLGNDGSDAFKRAQEHDTHKSLPDSLRTNANVLVFLEMGLGPYKYYTGEYKEQLRFASSSAKIYETYSGDRLTYKSVRDPLQTEWMSARLMINGQTNNIAPADDLHFQAVSRGGRVMDHVLANKAVFKKTTDTIGNTAILTGAAVGSMGAMSGSRDAGYAGLAILAIGLIAKGISAATTPTADIRCWDNLPQYLSLGLLQLPLGKHDATVEFIDANGTIIKTKTIAIQVADVKKETVLFVSDR